MSRNDVRSMSGDSSTATLRRGLIETISGFKPETVGTICDYCNAPLSPESVVFVEARFSPGPGSWDLIRAHCERHEASTSPTGTNAVVRCETGNLIQGEWLPLLNPEIVAFYRDGDEEALDAP